MSNFTQLVKQTALRFEHIITTTSSNLSEVETEDFGWINHRWFSQQFRMAHVERFEQPRFVVLHTVIFPHITDPSPIFGFDIIASDVKSTGLFFDLSPTVLPSQPISDLTWSEPRERPSWGTIFGEHWIACRPTFEEAELICNLACEVLEGHIKKLGTTHSSDLHHIVKAQNNYSINQRKNEHTTRVIRKLLGEERGEHFINHILFPTI